MSSFNEINNIQMNPQADEYMDIDRYNSYAQSNHPEYSSTEKKGTNKKTKGSGIGSFILKADLIATIVLVTAVGGQSILSEHFEETFSPVSCDFVETITDINEIDYYLSIDSLEKTLGNVELRVSGVNYNVTFDVKEGKNLGEIKGLSEDTTYTLALYDGGYLVRKTEVKTLTAKEKEERAWRKFFDNFFSIDYDKESDLLKIKMKIVDDLNRYEFLAISIYDESGGETFKEVHVEEMNELVEMPVREAQVYGKELQIMIIGYLKYIEEETEQEEYEDFLYEGSYLLDEAIEPNNENETNNG